MEEEEEVEEKGEIETESLFSINWYYKSYGYMYYDGNISQPIVSGTL